MSNLVLKVVKNALWQPVESPRQAAGDKTHMATLTRELQLHAGSNLAGSGQSPCRQERVVLGIEQQRRQPDAGQPGFAGGSPPIGLLEALRQ